MAGRYSDNRKVYGDSGFFINNVPKSALNSLNAFKRAFYTASWVRSYYYVMNVNRARVKRCISSRFIENEEDIT